MRANNKVSNRVSKCMNKNARKPIFGTMTYRIKLYGVILNAFFLHLRKLCNKDAYEQSYEKDADSIVAIFC